MDYPNIFTSEITNSVVDRIEKLTKNSKGQWGKMSVDQMLAHNNVTYEMVFTDKHPKTNAFARFLIKAFAKKIVTGPVPYKKNNRTAPMFIITGEKDFEAEKARLINYLKETQALGEAHFDNKESHSFGKLSVNEWNNLFYKHIDHHLTQFGV